MAEATAGLVALLGPYESGAPAYSWLAERIQGLILDGRLLVGDRVPSERALAVALGLSRSTVTAAFDLLREQRYLVSSPGSNTVIALPRARVDRPDQGALPGKADDIDLSIAALPAPGALGQLALEAAQRLPGYVTGHGLHPLGLRELRVAIAARLTGRGLRTSPEQVLVTQGALHGWDLVLRSMLRPGERVLVEQPTYASVLDAARAHHGRLLTMGVDEAGWQLARTSRQPAVIAHVTPDFQNPTGFNASDAQRKQLLKDLPDTMLVIDETFAELSFGQTHAPLGSFDRRHRCITLGTLSKTVWAGLRVGWIRADEDVVRRLALSRSGQDLATPVLDQLLALACLEHLDEIVAQRLEVLMRRRDHLLGAIAQRAPHWRVARPDGGLVLWVELGEQSSTQLTWDARRNGLRLIPGTRFSATGTHDRYLRLPFTAPTTVLDTALDRLLGARGSALPVQPQPQAWTA